MLKNYLIIATRNLLRHKLYSAINLLGLAVGIACCLLVLCFVRAEWLVDRHYPKAERIYRVSGHKCASLKASNTSSGNGFNTAATFISNCSIFIMPIGLPCIRASRRQNCRASWSISTFCDLHQSRIFSAW